MTISNVTYAGVVALLCLGCEGSESNGGAGGSGNPIGDGGSETPDSSLDAREDPLTNGGRGGAGGTSGDADASLALDADAQDGARADGPVPEAGEGGAFEAGSSDGRACNVVVAQQPDEGKAHAPECDPVSHRSNPPSSGIHYGQVPAFGIYAQPLPRGYWIHSLEHGSVVITYNCPEGCADEVAQAEAAIRSLPLDPMCVRAGISSRRIIMTPDPLLDTRWAASSWGYTLRATCFDADAVLAFYRDHVNHGLENLCNYDFNPRTDAGTLNIRPGCGQ